MGLFDQWNKNRFSIYKNEEKTVLKLLESVSKWIDVITVKVDEVDNLSTENKNKKVSYDDLHNKYKLTQDGQNANYNGKWQGLNRPTLSDEGMRATVEKIIDEDLPSIIKHTTPTVNVGSFNVFKDDLTKDSTQGFQDAIDYAMTKGGGIVSVPSGKYLINGTIIIPSEVKLVGSGKNFEGGTILWREENTGIVVPFIQLGNKTNNGAVIECGVSDLVIIGDSTVKNIIGIENKGVSVHAIVIKNIEFECFAGTPIKLSSTVESSRVQFIEIDNIDVGFDWGVYKPNALTPKTNNNICGGVWLEGYIDGIYINNCRFTNYIDTSDFVGWLNSNTSYGIRIESYNNINPKNNIKIENCFFRGFKSAIFTNAMNTNIVNNYIEHCKSCVYLQIKDVSSIVNIYENYSSGCEKLLYAEDRRTEKSLNCYVNVEGNYIKWGVFNKSYLFDGEEGITNLFINNGFNCIPNTWLSTKFEISTTNIKPNVYGITRHNTNYKKMLLSNPIITNEGETQVSYTLRPNTSGTSDYGLDIIREDGKKVATFHDKNTQLYTYDEVGIKTTVMRVDETKKQCEFPTNIILRGSGGKRYQIGVNDSGQLFTSLIQ